MSLQDIEANYVENPIVVIDALNVTLYEEFPTIIIETPSSNLMNHINTSENVKTKIISNKNYFFLLPRLNTILYMKCSFSAINAADMEIIYIINNNVIDNSKNGCTLSYKYSKFDTIHYTSFSIDEKCFIFNV